MAPVLEAMQQWAHTILLWIGFGTVVGLAGKALMPGRDQGGALATLLVGIGGSVVGLGVLAICWEGHRVTPLSLLGFLAATGGVLVILFFHRLLQGAFFHEEGTGKPKQRRTPRVAVSMREE